jgi:polyhydroxyalkanoate synthesis regulator phasin
MAEKKDDTHAAADENPAAPPEADVRTGGILGEAVKRIMTVGMTAAFVTEDTLRNYIGDLKLPKEVLNGLLQNATKSKEELANRVSSEIMKMLSKIDLAREAAKFLEHHKVRVSAEIEFTKKVDKDKTETEKKE